MGAFGSENDMKSFVARSYHLYLGPGWGELGVLRCTKVSQKLVGGWSCSKTEAWGLPSANGMTMSPDRKTLLVSVPEGKQIFRYKVMENQVTELKPPIQVYGNLDNLEWDETTNRIFLTTG